MNLPPEIQQHLTDALSAAAVHAARAAESFVSQAVGQAVSISSGPAGQIVVSPKAAKLPKNPARNAANLALPLLLGSALLNIGGRNG